MGNTTCSAPIPSPSSQVGRRKTAQAALTSGRSAHGNSTGASGRKTAPPSPHKPAPGARKQHRRQRPEDGTAQPPQAGARRTETAPAPAAGRRHRPAPTSRRAAHGNSTGASGRKTAPPSPHKPARGARKQHRRQRPEDGTAQPPQAGARRTETAPAPAAGRRHRPAPASRRPAHGNSTGAGGRKTAPPSPRKPAPGAREQHRTRCPAGVIHAGRASTRCGLRPPRLLLDGDRGAGALEGRLGLVSGLLVGPLEDRLRSAVHQVLGLLEAEAGQRPDLLDDLDLLVARRLQDDVELVLLLDLGRRGGATAGRRGHGSDRCRSLHVEGLLELLHKVRQLQEGHLLERVEQIAGAQLRHDGQSSVESSVVACGSSAAASASVPAASAPFGIEFSVSDGAGAPSPDVRLASSAAASLAICVGSAAIVATAFAIDAFMAPASIASRASRDSRSARRSISAGLIDLPSMTPPLISSAGLFLAKSRSPLAASTTSPLTNAIADGPVSRLPSWSATPASAAAIFVRVFLTTANVAWSPSERRSSASCATVSPR